MSRSERTKSNIDTCMLTKSSRGCDPLISQISGRYISGEHQANSLSRICKFSPTYVIVIYTHTRTNNTERRCIRFFYHILTSILAAWPASLSAWLHIRGPHLLPSWFFSLRKRDHSVLHGHPTVRLPVNEVGIDVHAGGNMHMAISFLPQGAPKCIWGTRSDTHCLRQLCS